MSEELYWYQADVIQVIDGDTLDVKVDLGFCISMLCRLCLFGISCPELFSAQKDSEDYKKGMAAKERVESLVGGRRIKIKTFKEMKAKYGRYLAQVFVQIGDTGEVCVNDLLVQEGLAEKKTY